MAFDPLQTDEKLDTPEKKNRDMDAQMLFGCSGFLIASIGGYILSVWPYFAFQSIEKIYWLVICAFAGGIPAFGLGIFVTRRFGIAGACGFVGAAMTTAIFLYLRIQQAILAGMARQSPTPEYPDSFVYFIPGAWVVAALVLAILCLPKEL